MHSPRAQNNEIYSIWNANNRKNAEKTDKCPTGAGTKQNIKTSECSTTITQLDSITAVNTAVTSSYAKTLRVLFVHKITMAS